MFPTQVGDWKSQTRVGGPPIGAGSSLGITDNPIEAQLKLLASIRDAHPELATGATVVRYAKDAVLVVSRIDLATHREAIVGFNNGSTPASLTVPTALGTPVKLQIPPVSAQVVTPAATIPAQEPQTPKLSAGSDSLTSFYRLAASVPGGPVSVAFAIRRSGGTWQRIAIDDSAPYRAFVEPPGFRTRERVEGVAVARGTNGTTAVSKVVTFVPNP